VTYHPGQIRRNDTFTYKKGTPVYLLDTGDGKVLVMQLWTNFVNKGETKSRLLVQDTHEPRLKVKDENVTLLPYVPMPFLNGSASRVG